MIAIRDLILPIDGVELITENGIITDKSGQPAKLNISEERNKEIHEAIAVLYLADVSPHNWLVILTERRIVKTSAEVALVMAIIGRCTAEKK